MPILPTWRVRPLPIWRTQPRERRVGPILYLVALALAFVNVYASVALNVTLAIFFALPHRLDEPGEANDQIIG